MLSIAPGVPGDMQRERRDAERGLVLEAHAASRTGSARPRRSAALLNTSHHPPNRRLTALRVAGQPDSKMKMRLVAQHDGEELVQLATRIPRDIARRLKEFCVRKEVRMQSFVRSALVEKLTHSRRSPRRQRSRG